MQKYRSLCNLSVKHDDNESDDYNDETMLVIDFKQNERKGLTVINAKCYGFLYRLDD